ncbi:MAG TPA: choice-of-anchor L domain-containing protein [Saprospiraceae bacterium]|nr:choice-of-anchor L domain-containing protein [Saprospiraceae bacterium]HPI05123.1 choice-of-anchor L domain-containing protein [Saprospiraceae bacterium]
MRKLYSFVVLLLSCSALFAQTPANDDCSGLVDLGPAPFCNSTVFSNENATPTNIGNDNNPTCFNSGVAQRDVWFAFTCPDTLFDFRITLTGVGSNSIVNPEFAVYRGDCTFDGLAELLCAKADIGENALFLDVTGLTPGLQYFIRVSDYSVTATPNSGDFTLCVTAIPPTSNVDDGGSTLCEGTLYDTGGPDGDYGINEDHTFVICPTQPSGCITFTLDYFNLEEGGFFTGDFLTFYDGDDVNAPIISQLGGDGFGNPGGGGGVCYTVQASSGCLTVQFQSDAVNEFEGWQGHWQCSPGPCVESPTMAVNTDITSADIVNSVATPATTVTVTNIDCPSGSYGTFAFASDQSDLGLSKGLVLTSGDANLAVGPNDSPSTTFAFNGTGDADLDYLSEQLGNGTPSTDACIVELDVFVATDELSFEYVFGSEEYPEFVGSDFNDIFAFLISGPGIVGDPGLTNAAKNIAVLPGSGTPVQINSVNQLQNWQYYRNNFGNQTIQYDGLTSDSLGIKKSLTARSAVIPCNTYHLKLAVADRQDFSYDSGVFVSEIKGATPNLAVQFASGIEYFIEDCSGNQDQLIISLSEPLEEESSFFVTVGGTATLGVDYNLTIPNLIVFPAGVTELSFPIAPISDALVEGTETITITLSNNFGCGTVVYKTLTIDIKDNVEVNVTGGDTLFVCAGNTLQLQAAGAANYFWAPPGAVSNPFIANPTTTPAMDITLVVTGTIASCVDMDTVLVRIVDPTVEVTALTPVNICLGSSVSLNAANNVNNQGLSWSPVTGLDNPNSPNPVATPTETTTYTAKITIAGCFVTDTVKITVDTLFVPAVINDTTVCQNYPVVLATNTDDSSSDYQWTPALGLSSDTSSAPLALPDATTTYTLVATSSNAACSQTETVTVTVIAADVNIVGDTYKEICLGETVPLVAESSPAGAQVVWSPSFYVSNPTGPNTVASPDESVTIFATYNINNCIVRDSVQIRVDSLPNSVITRVDDKEIYCPGDTILLKSPTYEPANFPDIDINWPVFAGELTPDSNWNLVLRATTTHTFERIVNNHACVDTARVEIPVAELVTIVATANPTSICPGETVQLNATVTPPQNLEWEEAPTLSCTQCPNPTVSPLVTTSYQVSSPDAACPTYATVAVVVQPAPTLNLAQNPAICQGGSVVLNNAPAEPGVTYTWTSIPAGFVSSAANPSVSPTQNTTYHVVAAGLSCDSEGDVIVSVPFATLDAGTTQELCVGETATLTATQTGTPGQVTWIPGNLSGASVQVSPSDTTTYTAMLVYGPNCTAMDQVTVNVVPGVVLSEINATPDPQDSLCAGTPIILKVTVSPGSAELLWSENGNPLAGVTADSISVLPRVTEGAATYTVIATNALGCSATRSVTYNLRRCLVIPNAFTPGNDDVNDTFGVVLAGENIEIVEFRVYNRWGQKVFESSGSVKKWDGRFDGDDAPSDVYVYYIKVRYPDGTEDAFHGDVTLLR